MASDLQRRLDRVLSDRTSPEADALFRMLLEYVAQRVQRLARGRCRGLVSGGEAEELVGEVLLSLMKGGLSRFRGETEAELIAYVRTTTDRIVWRSAERRIRERDTLAELATESEGHWTGRSARSPDRTAGFAPDSPLPDKDRAYLRELIEAGSKAALARARGVSRAAVTQRIQRIHARLAALSPAEQGAHQAWLERQAREVVQPG